MGKIVMLRIPQTGSVYKKTNFLKLNFIKAIVLGEIVEMEQYLKKIRYDPRHPGSFAGATKLYEIVKK